MTWVRPRLLSCDTKKTCPLKKKNEKFNFLKVKNFCSLKDTIKRLKRQVTEWEKIFANPISDKELYPEYIKNTQRLNSKKQSSEKTGQNRHFTEEYIWMAEKAHKTIFNIISH